MKAFYTVTYTDLEDWNKPQEHLGEFRTLAAAQDFIINRAEPTAKVNETTYDGLFGRYVIHKIDPDWGWTLS